MDTTVSEDDQGQRSHPPDKKIKLPIKILVILIVVIVIFAIIFVFVFNPGADISGPFIDLDYSNPDSIGVNVLAGSGSVLSLAGTGSVRITYDNEVVFTSKVTMDDAGNGFLLIPYNDFVEGNGEYLFSANYRDTQGPPARYEVNYIVERLDLNTLVEFENGEGKLTLNIYTLEDQAPHNFVDPEDVELTVNEIRRVEDGSFITAGGPPEMISENYVIYEYPYNRSGNYMFNVSLVNNRINPESGSPFLRIEETREIFLNILPVANALVKGSSEIPNSTNYTVEFDASLSINDGEITKYIWDFDNDGNVDLETNEPIANYSGYEKGTDYIAVLNVQGDVIIDNFNLMERGSDSILVEPP
jgi:hypothetical protein